MINMVDSTNPDIIRLKNEYLELGSMDCLALKYLVNVRYIWELLKNGKLPSAKICRRLGIKNDASPSLLLTRARRARLNKIAQQAGYKSWSRYETELLNEVPPLPAAAATKEATK